MTTTTIKLPRELTANQRGKHLKNSLAEIIKNLGYKVDIEKPYVIKGNDGSLKIDLVINDVIAVETKLYIDTNMAYKYVGPIEDIQTDNDNPPTVWTVIVAQDAGGFPWLQRHNVRCLSLLNTKRTSKDIVESIEVNPLQLKAFIDAALSQHTISNTSDT